MVLLPEAMIAKSCQSSTETGMQAGVVEVPATRRTSGIAVIVVGREETFLWIK